MKKINIMATILVLLFFMGTVSVYASDLSVSVENLDGLGDIGDDRQSINESESILLKSIQNQTRGASTAAIDLSTSRFFPPVGDQGDIGSCVGWATTYYQFGYQVASKYLLDVTSNSNWFSPKWVYNIISDGNDGGSNRQNAYKLLSAQGAVRYSQCTPTGLYTITEYRPWYLNQIALENALRYRVSLNELLSFSDEDVDTPITSYNSNTLAVMKQFLSSGQILTFSTDFNTWDYRTLSSQSISSLNGQLVCIKQYDSNGERDGHSMAIVGYNDNVTYDLNGDGTIQNFEKGAFKIANSHGTDYGNDGFMWVMYDALNKVSNASVQNVANRNEIIIDYEYDIIVVKEYARDLIVKVTLNQSNRNQITVKLGASTDYNTVPTSYADTMLFNNGGAYNFAGTSATVADDATFIFDYGDLYNVDEERGNYYIGITDKSGGTQTIVKNIEIIDITGKTVVEDTVDKAISGTTRNFRFKLGAVGDVNNDGNITASDASSIQKHISNLISLTNEDLLVADVNADGKVTASDASAIQKYVAKLIDEFDNGKVVCLS